MVVYVNRRGGRRGFAESQKGRSVWPFGLAARSGRSNRPPARLIVLDHRGYNQFLQKSDLIRRQRQTNA